MRITGTGQRNGTRRSRAGGRGSSRRDADRSEQAPTANDTAVVVYQGPSTAPEQSR